MELFILKIKIKEWWIAFIEKLGFHKYEAISSKFYKEHDKVVAVDHYYKCRRCGKKITKHKKIVGGHPKLYLLTWTLDGVDGTTYKVAPSKDDAKNLLVDDLIKDGMLLEGDDLFIYKIKAKAVDKIDGYKIGVEIPSYYK